MNLQQLLRINEQIFNILTFFSENRNLGQVPMVKVQLILLALIVVLLHPCQSGSIVGVVPQNSPYFASGAISLIATSSYQWSATITYKWVMKSSPLILLTYHSVEYDLNQIFNFNSSLLLNIDLQTLSSSVTGFTAIADVSTSTQLRLIKYGYFVFDNAFPYINSFDFVFVTYYNRNSYYTMYHSSLSHFFTIWLWGLNLQVYPNNSTSVELFHVYWEVNYVDSYTTQFWTRSAMTNYNNFQVRAILMVIYPTTIPKTQYQVETFFIHTYWNTTSTYQSNIFTPGKSNVIIGLNSFRLDANQNSPDKSFTFDVNHQITGLFTLTNPIQFDEVVIHGFIINFMGCPNSHPFKKYNYTTFLYQCHQFCAMNQYQRYDSVNGTYTCGRCLFPCVTCSNLITCITCVYYMDLNATFGCILKNTYSNISGVISLCSVIIDNCTTCLSDGSKCTTCVEKYAINAAGTACVPCSGIDGQCKTCTYKYCLSCNTGYVLFNETSCIVDILPSPLPLPIICDSNCSKCNLSNQHYCLICRNPQYVLSNGICISVCGDGKIMADEQCDDGNVQNFDGCSLQCKIQQSFICIQLPYTITPSNFNTSLCRFTSTISFVVRRIVKEPYFNLLTIYIETMIVYASAWRDVNLTKVVVLSGDVMGAIKKVGVEFDNVFLPLLVNSTRILQTSSVYNPTSYCYIRIQLAYNSSIQSKPLTITINPVNSGLLLFQSTSSYQSTFTITSNNNILTNCYRETYNNLAHVLQIFSKVLGVVAFVMILTGGVFGNMMITIETSLFCQLTYFSLLQIGQFNPFWYALSGLKFSSGYNIPFSSQHPIYQQKDHNNFIGIGLFSSIADNVNISLCLIVLTLMSGAIMMILNKFLIKKQEIKQKLSRIGSNFIGSVPLYLLHCFALLFTISIAINFITSSYHPINYAIIVLCLIIFISFIVFYLKCRQTQFFSVIQQKIGELKVIYLTLGLVMKVVLGMLIVVLGRFVFGCVIVGVVYVVWVVVVVMKIRPYKKANNIRFILSSVLFFFIQLMCIYQRFSTYSNSQQQSVNLYLPLSITILLFIILSLNLSFYLYSIRQIRCCQLQIQWQRVNNSNNIKTSICNSNNRVKIHEIQIDDNISQRGLSENGPNSRFDSKDNNDCKKLSNKLNDTTQQKNSSNSHHSYHQYQHNQQIGQQNPLNSILTTQQQHNPLTTTVSPSHTLTINNDRKQIQQQIKRQLKSFEMNYSKIQIKGHTKQLLKNTNSIYQKFKHEHYSGLEQSSNGIYQDINRMELKEKYVYTRQEKYCALEEYCKL